MSDTENLVTAQRYIAALTRGEGADEVSQFYAPDIVQEEFPNRLLPNGATRDLEALKQARIRGKTLLSAETFDLLGAVASGENPVRGCLPGACVLSIDSGWCHTNRDAGTGCVPCWLAHADRRRE